MAVSWLFCQANTCTVQALCHLIAHAPTEETLNFLLAQAALPLRRDKFGESGARIFNLLAGAGQQLEQCWVSERAMLPIKTARVLLYRMIDARYISLQVQCICQRFWMSPHLPCIQSAIAPISDRLVHYTIAIHNVQRAITRHDVALPPSAWLQGVPQSMNRETSTTYYTFRANMGDAFTVMQHDIVHALLNLRLRHTHERDKHEDVSGDVSGTQSMSCCGAACLQLAADMWYTMHILS